LTSSLNTPAHPASLPGPSGPAAGQPPTAEWCALSGSAGTSGNNRDCHQQRSFSRYCHTWRACVRNPAHECASSRRAIPPFV